MASRIPWDAMAMAKAAAIPIDAPMPKLRDNANSRHESVRAEQMAKNGEKWRMEEATMTKKVAIWDEPE